MEMAMAMAALIALFSLFILFLCQLAYETVTCYWLTPRKIKRIMERQGVSGPKPQFLLGNILEMAAMVSKSTSSEMPSITHDIVSRLLPHFVSWSSLYGKRFIYWNGTEPRMCLMETELIKELLTKHSTKAGKSWLQQQGSKYFIGKGLLMANGDDWHRQRHVVSPAFMGDKLKSYEGYMVESTEEMLKSLGKEVESGKAEFEIGEYMSRLTADIISRTEFDCSYEKGKQIFHLLTILQQLCAQASRHLCFPGSRFFPSKYNREIKKLKMEVEKLLMEIIQSRLECVECGRSSSYGKDMVGMLLNEMMKKKMMKEEFSQSLQVIMDECKTFFFTGYETTSLLLTWTVMLLASNPNWQDKVRAEVIQVSNGGPITMDHLSKFKLLTMVINESLRLYPPATVLPKMAFEDFNLGDLHIPKGLSIWIPVLAIHHNEDLWGKDVNEFNPERFASKSFSSGRFIPFSAGPRNCVGQSFAMMEAKIILSMLISRFKFTISNSYRHAPVVVLTIKPKYGVQVCLKRIHL